MYPKYLSSSSSKDENNPYHTREEFEPKFNEEKQKFITQWNSQIED